jgi:hypothetical protein
MKRLRAPAIKILLPLAFVAEIALVLAFFQRSEVHSTSAIQSWRHWRQAPSPETEEAWRDQKARLRTSSAVIDGLLLGLLGFNTVGVFVLSKRLIKGVQP